MKYVLFYLTENNVIIATVKVYLGTEISLFNI